MRPKYFVRFGLQNHIGLFEDHSGVHWSRGSNVVCQTSRGVEAAEVLNSADLESLDDEVPQGTILRPFTDNDRLLSERLSRYRTKALDACQELLDMHGIKTPLIDVEQLHDGENLFFYFLGEVDVQLNLLIESLVERFGKKIRFRQFAEKLAHGCGPGCGTAGSGCGSTGGCTSCSLSKSCVR